MKRVIKTEAQIFVSLRPQLSISYKLIEMLPATNKLGKMAVKKPEVVADMHGRKAMRHLVCNYNGMMSILIHPCTQLLLPANNLYNLLAVSVNIALFNSRIYHVLSLLQCSTISTSRLDFHHMWIRLDRGVW